MKVSAKLIICLLSIVLLMAGCSQSNKSAPSVSDEEVIVPLTKMDVHFKRAGEFSDTYMVFGGGYFTHPDMIQKITICGIPLDKAISIYEKYPDFDRCESPGAAVAQDALLDLNIITVDSEVLKILRDALSQHEHNIRKGGDRIFIKLEGESLVMTSVIMRSMQKDVMDQFPPKTRQGYYLVKSAGIVEGLIVFEDS